MKFSDFARHAEKTSNHNIDREITVLVGKLWNLLIENVSPINVFNIQNFETSYNIVLLFKNVVSFMKEISFCQNYAIF